MSKRIIGIVLALAILGSFVAPVAMALLPSQASTALRNISRSRAACGQGYWTCPFYDELELSRTGGLNPQWSGTGTVWRGHGNTVQACLITALINSNGTIHSSAVSCHNKQDN